MTTLRSTRTLVFTLVKLMHSATLPKGSWLIIIATLMSVNDEICSFEILRPPAREGETRRRRSSGTPVKVFTLRLSEQIQLQYAFNISKCLIHSSTCVMAINMKNVPQRINSANWKYRAVTIASKAQIQQNLWFTLWLQGGPTHSNSPRIRSVATTR